MNQKPNKYCYIIPYKNAIKIVRNNYPQLSKQYINLSVNPGHTNRIRNIPPYPPINKRVKRANIDNGESHPQ